MDNDETSAQSEGKTPVTRDRDAEAQPAQQRAPDDHDALIRTNRRRVALIGMATGAVMALLVLLCLLLAYLLSTQ